MTKDRKTTKKDNAATTKTGQNRPLWKPGTPIPEASPDDPIYKLGFVIQPINSSSFSKSTPKKQEPETGQKEQTQVSSAKNAEKSAIPQELLDQVHENIRREFHEQMRDPAATLEQPNKED